MGRAPVTALRRARFDRYNSRSAAVNPVNPGQTGQTTVFESFRRYQPKNRPFFRLTVEEVLDRYGRDKIKIGMPDNSQFVMPKAQMDDG